MKYLIASLILSVTIATSVTAAEVDTRLSTREAYVGSPVVLQLSISDARDFEQPTLPSIDGCDVRSAGAPSQSSQITIINGRRSERRSVTLQYLITPRREGTFTIPAMTITVDGQPRTTQPQRFVATKSETGDLMFVEITGGKEKVFVGQPLDLTLKIWIKPYRDAQTGQTLSEEDMWNMISESTSWGAFADRIQELAENRQRPGGREVLRDDGHGNQRAYYLYSLNATVYPKRAGTIDASDVQIVVNYPTAIGQSRGGLGSIFDDDMFGGNSPMSRLLNDDFFGSPFGNQLSVTSSRPIAADVSVDATQVLPVPTEGRPADYRGAVGIYRIVTQASPTTVDAGDPITLNIGIAGNGPMELLQSPPLSELAELTADFKVPDQSLAGFVQDDTKVFSTTIRPRRAGIQQIPPIRFSFFDPDSETFQTVVSEPIAITVNKSEVLALDSIVASGRSGQSGTREAGTLANLPDLTNHSQASVLVSQTPGGQWKWWWVFVVVPPLVWIVAVVIRHGDWWVGRLPSFRSSQARCLANINRAKRLEDVERAMVRYILERCGTRAAVGRVDERNRGEVAANEAIGALRVAGLYAVAAEFESFLATHHGSRADEPMAISIADASELINKIEAAVRANKKNRVKTGGARLASPRVSRQLGLLLAASALVASNATSAMAEVAQINGQAQATDLVGTTDQRLVDLSAAQQQVLLSEASEAYSKGLEKAKSDSADAKELFTLAASKYQLLVDGGIRNSDLFINLGNAYLQSGKIGYAIANYEKALQLDPGNSQAHQNLVFANEKIALPPSAVESSFNIRSLNEAVVKVVGRTLIVWILVISSVVFWGLLILRVVHRPFATWKFAALPLLVLLLTLGSVGLTASSPQSIWNAVIVADNVSLHAGDGEQFDQVIAVESAQGQRVAALTTRGQWTQIKTADGHVGWVPNADIELVTAS